MLKKIVKKIKRFLLGSPSEYIIGKGMLVKPKSKRGLDALNDLSGAFEEI